MDPHATALQFEAEWKCMVCFEIPFANAFQAPCGHVFCRPCVNSLKSGDTDGVRQCPACAGDRGFIHAVIPQPKVCATLEQLARSGWPSVWAMFDRAKGIPPGHECELFSEIAVGAVRGCHTNRKVCR